MLLATETPFHIKCAVLIWVVSQSPINHLYPLAYRQTKLLRQGLVTTRNRKQASQPYYPTTLFRALLVPINHALGGRGGIFVCAVYLVGLGCRPQRGTKRL